MDCQACRYRIPKNARFCPQCGLAVGHAVGPMGKAAESAVAERSVHREFHAERRIATVMFADISGFTSFSETADPEHTRALLNACFQQLVPIILEHGGQIDKFIGDEIMALFGAKQANEDDASRALDAALCMMAAMDEFSRSRDVSWGLHVGINTGLVVAGMVGAEAGQFSVIGDAVNVAARLVGQAKSGEIIVGEKTCRLARDRFDFEPVQSVRLKGKSSPVDVYRLIGPRNDACQGRFSSDMRSRLLGRDDEVATITGLLQKLERGQSFILLVSGEAGMGKSRLLAEIRRASSLRWFEGKSVPMGRSISFWPFIQILREIFGIAEGFTEPQAAARIAEAMCVLFPNGHHEFTPYLARLLSVRFSESDGQIPEHIAAEDFRLLAYRAVHRLFRRMAEDGPIVLVFEDVHWADLSSLDLIEHVASLVREVPMGLLLVERSEEAANTLMLKQRLHAAFQGLVGNLNLPPLPCDASRRLCEMLLKVEEFELAPAVDMVIAKAEGNPFFLEEMIKALIDMKILVPDVQAGGWKVQGERLQIPDSLSAVVLSRLDRLEDGVRDIVKYASVVGRSFLYNILLEMTKDRDSLETIILNLLHIEIIREKMNKHDREYIFKHALFQKVAYDSILRQERKALHRHVAQIIELLFGNRLEEFFGLLAYHYTQAEEWKNAHEYLQQAGEKAGRIGADAEALELYHQTLTTYHKAFGGQIDPFDAAVMQRKMGEAFFRKGQHHLAEECLLRALEYYGKKHPSGKTRIRFCILRNIITQLRLRVFTNHGLDRFEDDFSRNAHEVFRIRQTLGFIYFFTNRELYLLNTLNGLNDSEKAGCKTENLYCLLGFGIVLTVNGLFSIADFYFQRASKFFSLTCHEHGLYYHLTAYHEDCKCSWDKAREFYDKAISMYKKAGEIKLWASAACLRVELSMRCGEDAELPLELAKQIYEMGHDSGDKQLLAWGRASIGLVLRCQGKYDEAINTLEEASRLLAAIPDYYILLCCYGHLMECRIQQEDLAQAFKLVERGEALISAHGLVGPFVARLMVKKGHASVRCFESDRTPVNRSRAYEACVKAIRAAKKFRAFLPESYMYLGRFQHADGRARYGKTLAKGLDLARSQGNGAALRQAARTGALDLAMRSGSMVKIAGGGTLDATNAGVALEVDLPANQSLQGGPRP